MSAGTRKFLVACVIFLITMGILAVLSNFTPYLENLELKSYDLMMSVARGPIEPPPVDIVIVAIDAASIDELSDFPWPRSMHAELIRNLNEAGARAIAFDVAFDLESDPVQDRALAEAIRDSRAPVIVAAYLQVVDDPSFSMVQARYPIESLIQAGAKVGFVDLNPDRDYVLRHARLTVRGEPSLALKVLHQLGLKPDLGEIPVAAYEVDDPEILINYIGGARSIRTVSYYQALDYRSLLPQGIFLNKVVLVGRSEAIHELRQGRTEADLFASPFDLLGDVNTSMPGVEVHANTLNTLLRQNYIRRASPYEIWGVLLFSGIVCSVVVLVVDSLRWKILISLLLLLGCFLVSALGFVYGQTWVYSVHPTVMLVTLFGLNTLYQYRLSEKERSHIRKALKGYVSKQVLNEILKHANELELGGVQVEATVLFSDIAGFSQLSENMGPKELTSLMNSYFARMGDVIMHREGMINKYIGDAIMAVWGAPLPNDKHALQACQAALEMKQQAEGTGALKTRIGINTGLMVAGNLGHLERMEYTVIGDAVNLSSRLEGANKFFGTTILISEFTEQHVRGLLLLREVDSIRVAGKQRPVKVYELVAEAHDSAREQTREMVASFEEILILYRDRDWKGACGLIEKHLQKFPFDSVAAAYLGRCRRFLAAPPPPDWDGVYALESK